MKAKSAFDAINEGHGAQERLLAIGDLLSSVDEKTVSETTVRVVGMMLMDEADKIRSCLDILWENSKRGAA